MKIAICLSGQCKAAIYAFPNLQHFLGDLFNTADFFIHTWTTHSERETWSDPTSLRYEDNINEADMEKYINLYQPIDYKIERQRDFGDFGYSPPSYYKYYSIYKSVLLKHQYEITNKFTYDVVIKIRPDLIIDPAITIYNILDYLKLSDNFFFVNDYVIRDDIRCPDDVVWIADSLTMNKASLFSRDTLSVDNYADLLGPYLKEHNIVIDRWPGPSMHDFVCITKNFSIMRFEALEYNSINDYKKCLEIDRNIYWAPDIEIAKVGDYLTEEEWRIIIKKMIKYKPFLPPHLTYLK
jgi:hypothetical protein